MFESAHAADIVLLDKTGTVTEGEMRLVEVLPLTGFAADDVLAMAAAAESGSEHPVARAVIDGARQRSIEVPPADRRSIEPGAGASAVSPGTWSWSAGPSISPTIFALRSIGSRRRV